MKSVNISSEKSFILISLTKCSNFQFSYIFDMFLPQIMKQCGEFISYLRKSFSREYVLLNCNTISILKTTLSVMINNIRLFFIRA